MIDHIKAFSTMILTAVAGETHKEAATGGIFAIIGLLTSVLGGWDKPMQILLWLMVADYITGVLGAIKTKTVNSDIMFWGGIRKITVLFVVALAVLIDGWVSPGSFIFRALAIYFYIGREGLSVVENLGTLGVPMPDKIKGFLEQLNEKGTDRDAAKKLP